MRVSTLLSKEPARRIGCLVMPEDPLERCCRCKGSKSRASDVRGIPIFAARICAKALPLLEARLLAYKSVNNCMQSR